MKTEHRKLAEMKSGNSKVPNNHKTAAYREADKEAEHFFSMLDRMKANHKKIVNKNK